MANTPRFLNPYLAFKGEAENAANYYAKVLKGKIERIMKYKDSPHGPNMPENEKEMIMHAALRLPDDTLIMFSDNTSSMKMEYKKGNDITLSLHPESKDEADRLFKELSEGGNPMMPMQDTFWKSYFGMLTDKFGINWMVNYEYPAK